MMPALGLVGTVVGFGGFGYAVVKLTKKDWKAVAVGTAVGAASLALVGWNLRTLRDVVPFGAEDYMNRDEFLIKHEENLKKYGWYKGVQQSIIELGVPYHVYQRFRKQDSARS